MEGKKPTLKLCNVIGPGTVVIGKQREKKKKKKKCCKPSHSAPGYWLETTDLFQTNLI